MVEDELARIPDGVRVNNNRTRRMPHTRPRLRATIRRMTLMAVASALALTWLTVAAEERPASAAGAPLSCEPGYTYSVSIDGYLRQIGPDGAVTQVGTQKWPGVEVNGLGITSGGTEAYAFERWRDPIYDNARGATILRYNASTGTFTKTGDFYNTGLGGNLIAGAVNLSSGKFLFGGFEGVQHNIITGELRFRLFEYDPARAGTAAAFSSIGYFWTGKTYTWPQSVPAANGDMAFDAAGNLYVVRAGNNDVNIYTVPSAELSTHTGGQLKAHATPTMPVTLPTTNGIAFDADGTVNLGADSAVNRHDPNTWSAIQSRTTALSSSTDLANCASPPTLTLQKNAESRKNAGDQFALSILRNTTVLDTQTTTGSEAGVQSVKAGPTPVVSGQTYRIREVGAGGANLDDYQSSWGCKDTNTGAVLGTGLGKEGTVTVPAPTSAVGPNILCEFTNAAKATLTLKKDFNIKYGAEAQPADWKLRATPSNGTAIDFASGETKTVPAGQFRIGEDQRSGYELERISCVAGSTNLAVGTQGEVTIPAGKSTVCTVVNRDLPGNVTWNKTDSVTGAHLAGSEWSMAGPGGPYGITDNTGSPGYVGLDQDPAPGKFQVAKLTRGTYVLTETKAPTGYEITQKSGSEFKISNSSLEVALPPITNRKKLTFGIEKYALANRESGTLTTIDGAKFEVSRDESGVPGTTVTDAVVANGVGMFTVHGLLPGNYWLVETQAPADYAKLVEPVAFTVLHDGAHPDGALELAGKSDPLVELSDDHQTIRVSGARPVGLPEAGSGGASGFPLIGIAIALGGLAALGVSAHLRRRASASTSDAG